MGLVGYFSLDNVVHVWLACLQGVAGPARLGEDAPELPRDSTSL